ncbi:MAG: 16S rRNA (uracil(1498)-N(3))-methyltransferase [Chloroflexaceae bacterium]|nr:16S rRNA (uracil(1498)-N(3))-methyltransferase [Chloroflexaceae bacterium]
MPAMPPVGFGIPNTYRFFVPPDAIVGKTADLVNLVDEELAHRMLHVLRLRPGRRVVLLDNQGNASLVQLTRIERKGHIQGHVEQTAAAGGELATTLVLYVALLQADRFEWVLQKGTELGVRAFGPVESERSLPSARADRNKQLRWQRIVCQAAEQSCRGRIPAILEPLSFAAACARAAAARLRLLLWEGATLEGAGEMGEAGKQPTPSLRSVLRAAAASSHAGRGDTWDLAVLSGPEGGLSPEELTTAAKYAIIPVSLGPRLLRAETAPIAAAAAIFYELEE